MIRPVHKMSFNQYFKSWDKRFTSVAILDRAQGQRPSSSRLFSSINAMTTGVDGCNWPRDRKRRS